MTAATLEAVIVISICFAAVMWWEHVTSATRAIMGSTNGAKKAVGSTWDTLKKWHKASSLVLSTVIVVIAALMIRAGYVKLFAGISGFIFTVLAVDLYIKKQQKEAKLGALVLSALICFFWTFYGLDAKQGQNELLSGDWVYNFRGPTIMYMGVANGNYYTLAPHTKYRFEWQRSHCVRDYPPIAVGVDGVSEAAQHKVLFWSEAGTVKVRIKDLGPGETWKPTPGDPSNDYTCPPA